ncbi:MAG: family 20 glycosylhydrolase [Betaproteobacteria bacterium]
MSLTEYDRRGSNERIAKYLVCLVAGVAFLFMMFAAQSARAQTPSAPAIIPNPLVIERGTGTFRLSSVTPIVIPANDRQARRAADYLRDLVQRTHGMRLQVQSGAARDHAINIRPVAGKPLAREAYRLVATPDRVTVSASDPAGLLYGGISLWQLIEPGNATGEAHIAGVSIDDAPRFAWRGLMLDSARHYQSAEFIRHFIDWMALHKLNVLHWHLTDDQAWRLEIRKYPRLTEIGAWRVPARAAAQADIDAATGKPRLTGGFYSQTVVREIVAHAARRGVTIVPEIEMPGHAAATLVAYPRLGASGRAPAAVPADWGIYDSVYNVEDSTFAFLEDVLKEVMALFPGKYLHVGGDEVVKTQWKESPQVQARMKVLGITEPAALQVYFTQRIGRFLQNNGRRLVGWDEILEPGLPPSSVVMSWRGVEGALTAATRGFDTILSPWPTLYFDNRQSAAADELPGRGRVISLENVYRFEPMPDKLTPAQQRHVIGLQGNVWTEHIRLEERVGYMTFPRAAAIAESGWSAPARRDWPDFVRRMAIQVARYDALKIPYADSAFAVQAGIRYAGAQASVELSTQAKYGEIRYSLDGRDPTSQSSRYQGPVTVPLPGELRAAAFAGEARLSRPRVIPLRRELARRLTSHEMTLCSANIDLALEDDASRSGTGPGPRAVFMLDINNPCWIFPQADLDTVTGIVAAVGQVPFNFQIGEDVNKIKFTKPATPGGELDVHLGQCDGEIIARLPLAPATASNGVTVLPQAMIAPQTGRHDLCLRFAQRFDQPSVDPVWALDWIQLTGP